MRKEDEQLAALTKAVAASAKYRDVSEALVQSIGAQALAKGLSPKAAIKATKNKLHQVAGAYHQQRIDYEAALTRLREANTPDAWRSASREIMRGHASTRERLPILDRFYGTVLAGIPAPRNVLDVACGLNPLAWPWMPLAQPFRYAAYDIYGDMTRFLQEAFQLAGIDGQVETRDVIHDPPRESADLAFLLKTLPCLEQIEKGASERLLDRLRARYLLISYPVATLGGRQKGMVATYDAQVHALLEGRGWRAERFLFESELAYLVDTGRDRHVYDA